MIRKLFGVLSIISILALAFTLTGGAGIALAMPACDPAYVTITGTEITVSPTGVSDTANLQCAFDAAVAAKPGTNVRLVSGTYHTAQIVVNGFYGQFTGVGIGKTLIVNLPDLYVTPVDMYLNPPSASNPWPSLFAFVNGDFSISNMAIHIIGDEPTTGWTIFGINPPIKELAIAIVILGTEAHVQIDHMLVEGERMENSLFGFNLIQAFYFEGFIGRPSPPISGSFSVQHSTLRRMGSGTPVLNLANASVEISHNTFEDMSYAMDGGDFMDSRLEFSHNEVASIVGPYLYNMDAVEDTGTAFLFRNNAFSGAYGIYLEQTFGVGNQCLILGNNMQHVTDIGIYLSPGIHGCTVVGGSSKTNVLDLGTDNILVGVNNMGTGVGPMLSTFMKMKK